VGTALKGAARIFLPPSYQKGKEKREGKEHRCLYQKVILVRAEAKVCQGLHALKGVREKGIGQNWSSQLRLGEKAGAASKKELLKKPWEVGRGLPYLGKLEAERDGFSASPKGGEDCLGGGGDLGSIVEGGRLLKNQFWTLWTGKDF